jgi:hypothetical protein
MLRPLVLLFSASLTCAVVHFFGFTGLFVCFGLAFLTLVFSAEGEDMEASGPENGTQPAAL